MFKFLKTQATRFRITLGLVSIIISTMLLGVFVGLMPDEHKEYTKGKVALAEVIAANSTLVLTHGDVRRMEALLALMIQRAPEIRYGKVLNDSGESLATVGTPTLEPMEKVDVPIFSGEKKWGRVELYFDNPLPQGFLGFFYQKPVHYIVFVAILSFFFSYFYLGRMLKMLDPSQAIPDRVRSALDTMAEGLLVLDAKQNIVLANEAFSLIVDSKQQDLLGKNIDRFKWENIDRSEFKMSESPWGLALAKGVAQTSIRVRLKTDSENVFTFMVNCSPVLTDAGKAGGVLISFDDVTMLEKKEIELQESRDQADIANRAKSEFLANMSHEIRTPMNAIMGFTEVLRRGYGGGLKSKEYLDTIASNSTHLLNLINEILDLSKVEAGRLELEVKQHPLHQIIHEVMDVLRIKAEQKNIQLEYKPLSPLPEYVHTDAAKLRQIITNLVGNAIKFTEKGMVRIQTNLISGAHGRLIEVAIVDSGIGMSRDQLNNVFDPFVQADSSITRKFGGTGLGLTISKRFAQALGGDITVSSELGKGSTFNLIINPGDITDVPVLQPQQLLEKRSQSVTAQKRWKIPQSRVLVVDDSPENRTLLSLVLGNLELDVSCAENGKQGYEAAMASSFDLILMDVQMPEMDGYTAVGLMRERGLDIPIIALTAHAMKGIEDKCKAAGYSGYLGKPIQIDVLIERVALELGGTEQSNADVPKPEVRSKLDVSNPAFKGLIEQFVSRMSAQMGEMKRALGDGQHQKLSELAHWLKGSAGTVGFHEFTEPAAELEIAAQNQNWPVAGSLLEGIESLFNAIDMEMPQAVASERTPIRSNLPDTDVFRPLIAKFVERLEGQIQTMEQVYAEHDYQTLADMAHWLKGAAGTVGFNQFTVPARKLGEAAKAAAHQEIKGYMVEISALHRAIELSSSMESSGKSAGGGQA